MTDTETLLRLIADNPDLPIVPMVDSDVVADCDHQWWLGRFRACSVDEYYVSDERVYLSDDFDEVVQEFIDSHYHKEPYTSMTDEELEALAIQTVKGYEWQKAIVLWIMQ